MTQHDTPVSASLLASLLNGAAGYAAQAADLLADTSLTVDRWRVLELVSRHCDLTMSGLATQLGVPSSTATRIVDHLVSDGALHRVVDQVDRRRVLLRVTDRGRTTLSEVGRHLGPLEAVLGSHLDGDWSGSHEDGAAGPVILYVVDQERARTTS